MIIYRQLTGFYTVVWPAVVSVDRCWPCVTCFCDTDGVLLSRAGRVTDWYSTGADSVTGSVRPDMALQSRRVMLTGVWVVDRWKRLVLVTLTFR